MYRCKVALVMSDSLQPYELYVACLAPLYMGFSRQEYWSGLLCPAPRDLPNLEIKPMSLMFPKLKGRLFTTSTTWESQVHYVTQPLKRMEFCHLQIYDCS